MNIKLKIILPIIIVIISMVIVCKSMHEHKNNNVPINEVNSENVEEYIDATLNENNNELINTESTEATAEVQQENDVEATEDNLAEEIDRTESDVGVEISMPTEESTPIEEPAEEEPIEDVVIEENIEDEEPSNYISLGEFTLTAYCSCEVCCGEYALNRPIDENGNEIVYGASGTRLVAGVSIAVDPYVIPYGSEVMINGNTYVAQDTGGAINGNRIDVYFDNHEEAWNFGLQYAEVFLIK